MNTDAPRGQNDQPACVEAISFRILWVNATFCALESGKRPEKIIHRSLC